jgi:hypothetical protein
VDLKPDMKGQLLFLQISSIATAYASDFTHVHKLDDHLRNCIMVGSWYARWLASWSSRKSQRRSAAAERGDFLTDLNMGVVGPRVKREEVWAKRERGSRVSKKNGKKRKTGWASRMERRKGFSLEERGKRKCFKHFLELKMW